MVSLREHFKGCNGDLQRTGINLGHGLNHLVIVQIVWVGKILLMAEILHQLIGSLSHYLHCFITYTSQVVGNGISEPSTVSSQMVVKDGDLPSPLHSSLEKTQPQGHGLLSRRNRRVGHRLSEKPESFKKKREGVKGWRVNFGCQKTSVH